MASVLERTILVTEIPLLASESDDTKDKLEVHFGKKVNGGGDIEFIACPFGGDLKKALIVFESQEGKRFSKLFLFILFIYLFI